MKFEDFTSADELKDYLEKPFNNYHKNFYHYTRLKNLLGIFTGKKIILSQYKNANDKIEADFVKKYDEDKYNNERFFSLMRSSVENYGMWAMYGGMNSIREEKSGDDCVRIAFPKESIKKLIEGNSDLTARLIAYTKMLDYNPNEQAWYPILCNSVKNCKIRPDEIKKLAGFIKDYAWDNEIEMRICSMGENTVTVSDDFLKSLEIIPSPMVNVKTCIAYLKELGDYDAVKDLMNFVENPYFGKFHRN